MGWLRTKRRAATSKVLVGLLLLCTTTLIGVHTHAAANPLQADPLSGSHHCLLCVAAHLPLALSVCTAAPAPVVTIPGTVSLSQPETTVEPLNAFSLYMRPPPLA